MRAYIEAQGSLLRMSLMDAKKVRANRPAIRKRITGFSASSRRRLLRFMARLKTRKIRATFITLTFSGEVSNDEAKKALKRLFMRVRRAFPSASGIWRMERQKRGTIHFHLLMFNLPFWEQGNLQETWESCTREQRSIVDIRLVHGTKSVMAYVSKYIAKRAGEDGSASLDNVSYQHAEDGETGGRCWGYINKELLPLGQKLSGVLIRSDVILNLSKLCWALMGSDNPYHSVSFHLFDDRALHRLEVAIEEGGMYSDEWTWSQQVTEKEYRDAEYINRRFSSADFGNDYAKSQMSLSRGREAILLAPSTKTWTSRSSFLSPTKH